MFFALTLCCALLAKAPAAAPAPADDNSPTADVAAEAPSPFHWQAGPQKVALGHELTLEIPADDVFLAPPEAGKLLEANGNFHNDNLLGLVAAKDPATSWIVTVRYTEEGYVKDDETIDADALLKSLRAATDEANKERATHHFNPLTIVGWAEPPRYEKADHHLVWAVQAKGGGGDEVVNYNTRILGRKGYVALNLVTGTDRLAADRPAAAALLAATTFDHGARYEDFNSKTDKIAEYGLMALVAVGAAKLGLFGKLGAMVWPLLLVAKKFIVLAVAGAVAGLRRLFGRPKTAPSRLEPPPPLPPPPAG